VGGDRRTSDARVLPSVSAAEAERCFPSHSPYPSTLDRASAAALPRFARPSWGSFGARCSYHSWNCRAKLQPKGSVVLQRRAQRIFLSQAGPRFVLDLPHLSITFSSRVRRRLRNDEGDPFGSPSMELLCR